MLSRLTNTQMYYRLLHSLSLQVTVGGQNFCVLLFPGVKRQDSEMTTKGTLNAKACTAKNYAFLLHSLHAGSDRKYQKYQMIRLQLEKHTSLEHEINTIYISESV